MMHKSKPNYWHQLKERRSRMTDTPNSPKDAPASDNLAHFSDDGTNKLSVETLEYDPAKHGLPSAQTLEYDPAKHGLPSVETLEGKGNTPEAGWVTGEQRWGGDNPTHISLRDAVLDMIRNDSDFRFEVMMIAKDEILQERAGRPQTSLLTATPAG